MAPMEEEKLQKAKADFEKWLDQWFVVGIEIKRCASNPDYHCPICMHLEGRYPKTFFFPGGWHEGCKCIAESILAPARVIEEMNEYDLGIKKKPPFIRYYQLIPRNVLSYVQRNFQTCSQTIWYQANRKFFRPQH
jgi:hypothetical protein